MLLDASGLEYYKHVDEVLKQPSTLQNKYLQVHGFVKPASLQKHLDPTRKTWVYQFALENCGADLLVTYSGVVPDTFQESAELVVKGTLRSDAKPGWYLDGREMMAKCPSKYTQDAKHLQEKKTRCIQDKSTKDGSS